ncbi:MAG: hypothetical protein JXA60_10755 [Candidatus Coatesbacteria bacterium]|nr:hypothetical protein [Candidatus Coatesbacteria bacterium]
MSDFMNDLKKLIDEENKLVSEKEKIKKMQDEEIARIEEEGKAQLNEIEGNKNEIKKKIIEENYEKLEKEINNLEIEKDRNIEKKRIIYEKMKKQLLQKLLKQFFCGQ